MTQHKSALSHPAAPDSLSALRAAPLQTPRAVEGSELPAQPLHTPGEWIVYSVGNDDNGRPVCDVRSEGKTVAEFLSLADAERIVQCVNSHDDLLEAIAKLLDAMDMQEKRESEEFHIPQATALGIWRDAQATARAAIDRATS